MHIYAINMNNLAMKAVWCHTAFFAKSMHSWIIYAKIICNNMQVIMKYLFLYLTEIIFFPYCDTYEVT